MDENSKADFVVTRSRSASLRLTTKCQASPDRDNGFYLFSAHPPQLALYLQTNRLLSPTKSFYGRTQELATLEQWLIGDRDRLIAILGMGGVGKTSLAAKIAQQVAPEFEIVIWKSLRNAPDFNNFLSELVLAVCDRENFYLADTTEGQINNLMHCLGQKRCLLILDRLDKILASGKLGGQYLDGYQGYGQLLRRIQDQPHQSSVLITSREKPTGLNLREGAKSLVRSQLIKGLSSNATLSILYDRGLISSESTLKEFSDRCEGNPLILKMATATIEALFAGDVRHFLAHHTLLYGNIWRLLDQQSDFSRHLLGRGNKLGNNIR